MYRTDLRARLAGALEADPSHEPARGERLASVLLPIVDGSSLVFTRRTEHLPRHPGEISFPGGIRHDDDAGPAETALRETQEELGIPPSAVELLGALPPLHTFVSSILIVPFVGLLEPRPALHPSQGEIAEVLEYPLDALVAAERSVEWPTERGMYRGYAYEIDGHTIWGATAMILRSFFQVLGRRIDVQDADGSVPSRGGGSEAEAATYGPSDAELRSILGDARTVAVVGLSSRADRPSHDVAAYLQARGYRIVPVNPNETEVLGERAYPSLAEIPREIAIDVVDVFRRAEATPAIAAEAVARGAKVLWLQEGIVNEEARRIAEDAGLTVVMGSCMKHTSKRLVGVA